MAERLVSGVVTSISQLASDISEQERRVVKGEVTITWPYNSVNGTFAFLLSEPDPLLRRNKGQVRIQLRGPSARAVHACGLGGGDLVDLSLDGVEWSKDGSTGKLPSSRLECQLEFTERLLLQVRYLFMATPRNFDLTYEIPR
jgi:hypothetical protein